MKLPDVFVERISARLDMKERAQWDIGDDLVDFWDEIKHVYKDEVELKKGHAEFIRSVSEQVGAHVGTLNNMERMSRFYSKPERNEFIPPLTYYHLRLAMNTGEFARMWLLWCMEFLQKEGRTPTGDELQSKIKEEAETAYGTAMKKKVDRIMALAQQVQDIDPIIGVPLVVGVRQHTQAALLKIFDSYNEEFTNG